MTTETVEEVETEEVNVFVPAVAGVPVLWWGPPGIGKSQIIEDAFAAASRYCHTEVLSISDPCDIGGLLAKHEDRAIRLLPDWFMKLQPRRLSKKRRPAPAMRLS